MVNNSNLNRRVEQLEEQIGAQQDGASTERAVTGFVFVPFTPDGLQCSCGWWIPDRHTETACPYCERDLTSNAEHRADEL